MQDSLEGGSDTTWKLHGHQLENKISTTPLWLALQQQKHIFQKLFILIEINPKS